MRLDEDKLEALRAWGQGLRQAEGEELAATGRAILMLVEEIDRLHIELWHARLLSRAESVSTDETTEDEEPVASPLHRRLQRALRRDSEPSFAAPAEPDEEAESGTAGGDETTAAHSWIESLRRQK